LCTREELKQDPKRLWRIRLDVNIVSVPPPVRKGPQNIGGASGLTSMFCRASLPSANSPVKVPAVLNARRAGNRRKIQEKAQDHSGFGLKAQTPTPKSAQLASRAPARAAAKRGPLPERDYP
jgi:hypothetical protein